MAQGIHVVERQSGWAVHREGTTFDYSHHQTQASAIAAGRDLAKAVGGELFVHDRRNRFRERNSYGSDPYPPPG